MNYLAAIPYICEAKGITHAVISPGSRSAPLAVNFLRQKGINCHVHIDERSAAYIALGIAQSSNSPVALICTSGTAALNYAPAIAEAFYASVPLVVFTADRPPEWIDQKDGQAIRQNGIFRNHVKTEYEIPTDLNHPDAQWHLSRIVSTAVNTANSNPKGPTHINTPIREPFYESLLAETPTLQVARIIEEVPSNNELPPVQLKGIIEELNEAGKVLIIAGQNIPNRNLSQNVNSLSNTYPIGADMLSNLTPSESTLKHAFDAIPYLSEEQKKYLCPEILITFGGSFLSKNCKNFLKSYKPEKHWHIQPAGDVADTYQSLTRIIRSEEAVFLNSIDKEIKQANDSYHAIWKKLERTVINSTKLALDQSSRLSELSAVNLSLQKIPDNAPLHLGNSMPVRYACMLDTKADNLAVYSNRGTSGIDGTTSTCVGHAIHNPSLHTLITGDLSFFYDRNALWQKNVPNNLRIIVLNNDGGGIFRRIPGPEKLAEADEAFFTPHGRNLSRISEEAGLIYKSCSTSGDLEEALKDFYKSSNQSKLIEVFIEHQSNDEIMDRLKTVLSEAAAHLSFPI